MTKISAIYCVKDRDLDRLEKSIKSIKGLVNEIIVIDYGSKKPIDLPGLNVKIKRYCENEYFNKSHALNMGIKAAQNEFVMCIDMDIIVTEDACAKIKKNLKKGVFIVDTNVLRVKEEQYPEFKDKYLWFPDPQHRLNTLVNGGFQVFEKSWAEKVHGYDENIILLGGPDNNMYDRAKMDGLEMVDINLPIYHIEHKKQKGENFNMPKKIYDLLYLEKKMYLNKIIKDKRIIANKEFWGDKTANQNYLINKIPKIEESERKMIKYGIKKPSILIAVISNQDWPNYFCMDLIALYEYTKSMGYDVGLINPKSHFIDDMRNGAVRIALGRDEGRIFYGKRFDYLIMLDIDHRYPQDFIVKFVNHNKDVVTGVTFSRVPKYAPTQFKDLYAQPFTSKENRVYPDKLKGLTKVDASGCVGMLIKTDILEKIKFPWFEKTYLGEMKIRSEDVNFCHKLKKEAKTDIWLDPEICFPHEATGLFVENKGITYME